MMGARCLRVLIMVLFGEITFLGTFSEHVLMDTFPSNVIKHAFTIGIV